MPLRHFYVTANGGEYVGEATLPGAVVANIPHAATRTHNETPLHLPTMDAYATNARPEQPPATAPCGQCGETPLGLPTMDDYAA